MCFSYSMFTDIYYLYEYIYIYIYIHHITLHHITLHYTTVHSTALHYTTLHYITLHYTTLHYIHMLQYIFTCICIHWCSSIYQWVVTRKTFAKDQLRCTSKYHLHPGDLGSIYVRYIYIYHIVCRYKYAYM